jgi:hypothetical protein
MQMIERPWADSAVERSRLDLRSSWSSYGPDRKFLGYAAVVLGFSISHD